MPWLGVFEMTIDSSTIPLSVFSKSTLRVPDIVDAHTLEPIKNATKDSEPATMSDGLTAFKIISRRIASTDCSKRYFNFNV